MGHVPILLVAGDFLQIKLAKEISIADDLDALRQAGKAVHPEHHTAQDASLFRHAYEGAKNHECRKNMHRAKHCMRTIWIR